MYKFLIDYQVYILIGCSISCWLMILFSLVIRFQSLRKKKALIKIEISVSIQLLCEALTFIYDGMPTREAYWLVRISNAGVYMFLLISIYFLCEYITTLFMSSGRFEKLPKRLLLGFIFPSIGMTFVLLSAFTNLYYYIDAENRYHRASAYPISFLFPVLSVIALFSFVVQHRQIINKRLVWSIVLFTFLPIIAAAIQVIAGGISLITLACWQAMVELFLFALSDQNGELAKAANYDIKTDLPNTYGYMYEVDRVIHFKNITEYNGFYFDIVRMSQFNNKYGKNAGDDIIVAYATTLRDKLDKDEILGRLGGNFFVALIKKENTEKFLDYLNSLPVEVKINDTKVTLNISAVAGGYEIKKKNIAAGQILSNTATAVAYAKNVAHKKVVFLDDELEKELMRIRQLEESTKKAFKTKEFEAFYQPKVDSKNNVICGAEALARWRHKGKLIPPMDFVPIMEKNGSVCELDFYILDRVCQDIKEWLERGIEPVKVSVNFSRKNLGNPILSEAISKVVEKHGIPKEYIQIEITETIDEFPVEYLAGVVDALHRYGLTAAIDDFGTGSSSLTLLNDVNFDVLKIDKAFIDYEDEKGKLLLKDIISMTKDIGIRVVAEGVESRDRIEELKSMGCYEIQGYVYDKPLEISEFEKKLVNRIYK